MTFSNAIGLSNFKGVLYLLLLVATATVTLYGWFGLHPAGYWDYSLHGQEWISEY
jgi:hypothetical protein